VRRLKDLSERSGGFEQDSFHNLLTVAKGGTPVIFAIGGQNESLRNPENNYYKGFSGRKNLLNHTLHYH